MSDCSCGNARTAARTLVAEDCDPAETSVRVLRVSGRFGDEGMIDDSEGGTSPVKAVAVRNNRGAGMGRGVSNRPRNGMARATHRTVLQTNKRTALDFTRQILSPRPATTANRRLRRAEAPNTARTVFIMFVMTFFPSFPAGHRRPVFLRRFCAPGVRVAYDQ